MGRKGGGGGQAFNGRNLLTDHKKTSDVHLKDSKIGPTILEMH